MRNKDDVGLRSMFLVAEIGRMFQASGPDFYVQWFLKRGERVGARCEKGKKMGKFPPSGVFRLLRAVHEVVSRSGVMMLIAGEFVGINFDEVSAKIMEHRAHGVHREISQGKMSD